MSRLLVDLYEVKDSGKVTLTINITEGQASSTSVYLDSDEIVKGQVGNVQIDLPKEGAELKRKKLLCSTLVVDKLGPPKLTALTYKLTGGAGDREWSNSEKVAAEGDTVWFTAEFFLH